MTLALQAVEPSLLVPLVMGCRQAYLVGDPVQLPATVISSKAVEYGYDCSMFKRLQTAGTPTSNCAACAVRRHVCLHVWWMRQVF
jgi:superfamily I DNA and/or RNA helicase